MHAGGLADLALDCRLRFWVVACCGLVLGLCVGLWWAVILVVVLGGLVVWMGWWVA